MNHDSKIITFLRNFPAWIVLVALTIFFVMLYKLSADVAYKEWASLALASLFTALGISRAQVPQPGTNVENLNTDSVNVAPADSSGSAAVNEQGEESK